MLLIHPPSVRNCEPPVALLNLQAALRGAGSDAEILDGAIEAYEWLSRRPLADQTADRRAYNCKRKIDRLWKGLSSPASYSSFDKFKRDLSDLQYAAQSSAAESSALIHISPADFSIEGRSPLRIDDIMHAYEHPEDSPFFEWFQGRLSDFLPAVKKVGLSIGYLSQVFCGFSILGFIRKEWPDVQVQLGGSLITSWLKGPHDCSFLQKCADSVVCGPGEHEVVAFAGVYPDTKHCSVSITSDQAIHSNPTVHPDPGSLFRHPYIAPGKILPFSASRGCSWSRCTFCNERWENNTYCAIPDEKTIESLHFLSNKHDPAMIHLCDSEISLSLMKQMIARPPGPAWYSFSRFFPALLDMEFCRSLARSNCRMLCLGLESGDQKVLNSLKKGIRIDHVRTILANLKEVGIKTFIYVMFGTPAEKQDAALITRDFVVETADCIDYINAAVFNMPIMSRELNTLEQRDFYEGDLSLYKDFTHPSGFSRRLVREFLSREFYASPEIKAITLRTPPVFTSSLAAFF